MRRRSRSLLQENMTSVNLRQKLLLFLLILFSNYAGESIISKTYIARYIYCVFRLIIEF